MAESEGAKTKTHLAATRGFDSDLLVSPTLTASAGVKAASGGWGRVVSCAIWERGSGKQGNQQIGVRSRARGGGKG